MSVLTPVPYWDCGILRFAIQALPTAVLNRDAGSVADLRAQPSLEMTPGYENLDLCFHISDVSRTHLFPDVRWNLNSSK
jgi:hypothetical protein